MNYYELLGISPKSSMNEIDTAYKGFLEKYHRKSGLRTSDDGLSDEKLHQAKIAYSVLSVEWKRAEYDELLKSLGAFKVEDIKASNVEKKVIAKNDKEDQKKLQKIYSMMFMNSDLKPPRYVLKTVVMSAILLMVLYVLNFNFTEQEAKAKTDPEPTAIAKLETTAKSEEEPNVIPEEGSAIDIASAAIVDKDVEPLVTTEIDVPVTIKIEPPTPKETTLQDTTEINKLAPSEPEDTIKPWEYQVVFSCVFDDFSVGERVAPLKIETTDTDVDYFIKLQDSNTQKTVMTFYVIGGDTFESTVPLGSYIMKYATGYEWYGTEHLFGPDTEYYSSDHIFEFYKDGEVVNGWVIELTKRQGGNLMAYSIEPNEW